MIRTIRATISTLYYAKYKTPLLLSSFLLVTLLATAQAPTISSFTPQSGPVGRIVTISGTNFNIDPSKNVVFFGTSKATVTAASATSLSVVVPDGSVYRPISVLNLTTGLTAYSALNFIVTYRSISSVIDTNFIPAGGFSRNDFAPLVELTGVVGNNYTAVGDLDADGKPDLVTANGPLGGITIHKNKTSLLGVFTTASFETGFSLPTGTGTAPLYIAIKDLDGDGKLDIVTANFNSSITTNISIFRNKSVAGVLDLNSFETRVDFNSYPICCAQSQYIDINDLNGDGKPEIAVANRQTADVAVFENRSTPGIINNSSFASSIPYNGDTHPSGIRLKDLDGDQKPDYISLVDGRIHILQNKNIIAGPGNTFSSAGANGKYITINIPSFANIGIEVEDLDGDGKNDIIINGRSGNALYIFRNIHTSGDITLGSFAPRIDINYHDLYAVAMSPPSISDVDGDGKPDIIISGLTHDSVYVYKNNSSPGSLSALDFSTKLGFYTGRGSQIPTVADLNGDSKPDIVLPTNIFGKIGLIQNTIRVPAITVADSSTNVSTTSALLHATTDDQQFTTSVGFDYSTSPAFILPTYLPATTGGVLVAGTGPTHNTVNLSNLATGTRYYYRSKAVNAAGTMYSNVLNFTTATLIASFTRIHDSLSNRSSVDYKIVFANAITGLTSAAFALRSTGITGASISNITGSGTEWIITISTGTGDGSIILDFINEAGIYPSVANQLYSSEQYFIDKTEPVVHEIVRKDPISVATSRTSLIYEIKFSEPVTGVDISDFVIQSSTTTPSTISGISGSNSIYQITIQGVFANNTSIGLNLTTTGTGIKDIAGNIITTGFIGEMYIVDNIAPIVTGLTIHSTNSNSALAKPGDQVRLRFSGNEPLATPTVLIAAQPATVLNIGGNSWEATATVPYGTPEGLIAYSINCTDIAENIAALVTTVQDNSQVTFDQTLPVVLHASIRSDNTTSSRATIGNKITLQFTASEPIQMPQVSIAGSPAIVTALGGLQWKAEYTMKLTDTEGILPFSITCADMSGNTSLAIQTTTDLSSVFFDRTKPVVSNITITSDNPSPLLAKPGNIITLNFSVNEATDIPAVIIGTQTASVNHVGGNVWTAACILTANNVDGSIPYSIQATDITGNRGDVLTDTGPIVFDKILPILSDVKIETNHTSNTVLRAGDIITLSFTSSETIQVNSLMIGASQVYPQHIGANQWRVEYTIRSTDVQGSIPFTIHFKDMAGNIGIPVTATTNHSSILYDITQPFITSIKRLSPIDSITTAKKLFFRVFFSEPVTGIDESAFSLSTTGMIKGIIQSISVSSGISVDVEVDLTAFGGTIRLNVVSSVAAIKDIAGNQLRGGYHEGEFYVQNATPIFIKRKQQVSICKNDDWMKLDSLLQVVDSNVAQIVHWRLINTPTLGKIKGFPFNTQTTGTVIMPINIGYLPHPNTQGSDSLYIVISDGITTDTAEIIITIQPLPTPTITATTGTIICVGSPIQLEAQGGKKYEWWYKDTLHTMNDTIGKIMVNQQGSYTIIAESEYGCKAMSNNSIETELIQKPTAKFTVTQYCTNIPIQLLNESMISNSSIVSYYWEDNLGNTSNTYKPSFIYREPSTVSLKLKVSSALCPTLVDSLVKVVTIEGPPKAVRLPSVNTVKGLKTTLHARTAGKCTYRWSPSTGLSDSTDSNPQVNLQKEQQYLINITTVAGCITTDTLSVQIFERAAILVANVFTPNADGYNDLATINLVHIKELKHFKIFNRWGTLLYETKDPNKPWDGRVNGVLQPLDTYVWVAEAIDDVGVSLVESGNITLLR